MTVHLPTSADQQGKKLVCGSLTNTRILLVEDNTSVRTSLADMLESVGAKVHAVASGSEALDCLNAATFDIVVSDLRLPEMDGTELIARIRESLEVPIVLMSGLPHHSIMKALAGKVKPNAVLLKPSSVREIIGTIQQWTRHKPDAPLQVAN